MNVNTRESQEVGEQFDERDIRALNEHITVVPTYDGTDDVEGISPTTTCRIDTEALEGSCPDAQYNAPGGRCKHVRRYEFASSRRELPTWINEGAITEPFGGHVDDVTDGLEPTTSETSSGRVVATDGGTPTSESSSGVRDAYIPVGVDSEGAHHVYRTTDESVHVIEDGERTDRYDFDELPDKGTNEWIVYVDKSRGWDVQQLFVNMADAVAGALRGGA